MPLTVHVFLQDENAVKIHTVKMATNMPAGEIINKLIGALDTVEIEEIITITVKDPAGGKPRKIKKRRKYVVNLENITL